MNKNEFLKIMPENLKKYKNLRASAETMVQFFEEKIFSELDKLYIYKNMRMVNGRTLDELAWQWNVEFYSPELPKTKKIEMIRKSYFHYSKKGTIGVLESSLQTLIGDARISEFQEYNGTPYTFRLISGENIPNNSKLDEIKKIVATYKNVRSTLDGIIFLKEDNSKLFVKSTQHTASRIVDYHRKEVS
ncbi:MAG: phage tail protein [Fusobacteriaceae bacterium]